MKKLVHPDWEFIINAEDGNATLLTIENKNIFRKFVSELSRQIEEDVGNFVYSGDNGIMKLREKVVLVTDPLNVVISNKRVLTKIQQQMKEAVNNEEFFLKTKEILSKIEEFAIELESDSWINLTHSSYTSEGLVKFLNLEIQEDYENEIEKILEYMNVMHNVCGIETFVFLSMFGLFDSEELKVLIEESSLNKHNLIFWESVEPDCVPLGVKKIIIDKDFCQIF